MNNIESRSKTILNLSNFNLTNIPEFVSRVNLVCPHDRQYILRMLVKQSHHDYRLPNELDWLRPALEIAIKNQNLMNIRQPYCYITVRHGFVTSETDDMYHVDGFSMKVTHVPEQNYVWANEYPTEFVAAPIAFPNDFDPMRHNVHLYLQNVIERCGIKPHTLNANTLYCMDPYVIHRRPVLPSNIYRTFIRISFTPIIIPDDTNTQNPLIKLPLFGFDGVKDFRNNLLDYHKETL